MGHHTTNQRVLFEGLSKKGVTVQFDQDHASSDGGAVLLKVCDERLGLSATLAACLTDNCQRSKVRHSLRELLQQCLFGIACGYADGNDAARLADDPVMKLLTGRDPVALRERGAVEGPDALVRGVGSDGDCPPPAAQAARTADHHRPGSDG